MKLSKSSPIPALYFLLGELPIEARLHQDILSLFYNIWSNPDTTIHSVVKYLVQMAEDSSVTWSAHLRILCMRYNLPSPLQLLSSDQVWEKSRWATLTNTRITVFFENNLRKDALKNSKMEYLNVQVLGLSGIPHPALLNINTTQEVVKARQHIKLLSGDFLTAERLAEDQGTNPQCKLCLAPVENTVHILTKCKATADIHRRMLPELLNTVLQVEPNCAILLDSRTKWLTQFILDCTSLNLPAAHRIAAHNPHVGKVFTVARNWCYGATKARARLLQQLKKNQSHRKHSMQTQGQ